MAVNSARLAINDTLVLMDHAILAVKLEMNDSPSPDRERELRETISDLQSRKDELLALRREIRNSGLTVPPPSDEIMQEVRRLTRLVEEAANAGATAKARMKLIAEGLLVASKVVSHFPRI